MTTNPHSAGMVERVARAQFANAYADDAGPFETWEHLTSSERDRWLKAARAAIEVYEAALTPKAGG
jgi:acyl-CoA reductase-like NAD-dependent aldehyde dehydrogenase